MRVILKFKPLTSHSYDSVGAYDVQGFIYNCSSFMYPSVV